MCMHMPRAEPASAARPALLDAPAPPSEVECAAHGGRAPVQRAGHPGSRAACAQGAALRAVREVAAREALLSGALPVGTAAPAAAGGAGHPGLRAAIFVVVTL